jgi:hypothetical protein
MHHGYRAACAGCQARAMARSPHYFRCKQAGRLDAEYRAALQAVGLTHDQVKAAEAEDFMRREVSR